MTGRSCAGRHLPGQMEPLARSRCQLSSKRSREQGEAALQGLLDVPGPRPQRSSCGGGRAWGLALLSPRSSFWGHPEGRLQRLLAQKNPPAATCSRPCRPAAPPPTCLGEQVRKAGAPPPRWPHASHHQLHSSPNCEWKSTRGGRRAASPSGSRLPRHRIHAASQELFFHAWLPRELLKGWLVWPCLLSGLRLQPTALRPHAAPSKHPPRGGRAPARMRCRCRCRCHLLPPWPPARPVLCRQGARVPVRGTARQPAPVLVSPHHRDHLLHLTEGWAHLQHEHWHSGEHLFLSPALPLAVLCRAQLPLNSHLILAEPRGGPAPLPWVVTSLARQSWHFQPWMAAEETGLLP